MPYYKKGKINDRSYDDTKIWNDINLIDEKKTKVEKEVIYTDVEGDNVSADSVESYAKDIEILGNTVQDASNLADIRSVGDKVEGQELYKIDVVSNNGGSIQQIKGYDDYSDGYYSKARADKLNGFTILENAPMGQYTLRFTMKKEYVGTQVCRIYEVKNNEIINEINLNMLIPEGAFEGGFESTFTTSNEGSVLILGLNTSNVLSFSLKDDVNLSLGEKINESEKDKLTILSPTPLEKVGDVADRIICKDGVWGVEKNIVDELIDLSSVSSINVDMDNTAYIICKSNNTFPTLAYYNNHFINNLLPSIGYNDALSNDSEGVGASGQWVRVRVLKSKLKSLDLQGAKEFIEKLILKYPTLTPQFIPLPYDQQVKLRTFASKTNIHFETEIEGTIKASVPKSLGATVNTHTEQINNLNKELDRVKKLEESTVSTVTTESGFTTVEETSNGYFEDLKLEGRTLVNLVKNGNISKILGKSSSTPAKFLYNRPLELNKVYTLIVKTSNINETGDDRPTISYNSGKNGSGMRFNNGINITAFENKTSITDGNEVWVFYTTSSSVTSVDPQIDYIYILEGDHTNNPPSFFEGLKSVGDGVDEVSVASVNESLLGDRYYNNISYNNAEISRDKLITLKGNDGLGGLFLNSHPFYTTNLKPNSIMRFHVIFPKNNRTLNGVGLFVYDGTNGSTIANNSNVKDNAYIEFKVPSHGKVRLSVSGMYQDTSVGSFYIMLTDNTIGVQEDYIPHQSNKKPLLYYNPTTSTWKKPILRQWDSIEKHSDGKYYYHKRSGEVVLNGSENWYDYVENTEEGVLAFGHNIADLTHSTMFPIVLCDKFNYITVGYSKDVENISTYAEANGKAIYIVISRTKLSTQDIDGFKAWLQTNPTTVVYQLAQEEVYECTNIDLITYANETNLIINCGAIVPKTTLKVHNNIANVILLLQKEVSLLESESDKIFKDILSGDYRSLAYGLYPEDFDTED